MRDDQDVTQTAQERPARSASPIGELAIGEEIGRYYIDRSLGRGGMGVVYAAWDSELAREVALKVVRPRGNAGAMQARLHREAKAMARLSHRNVVPVFDIGMYGGQLFLAMALVDGETLRAWVTHPRPWREVVQVFAKAGRGLAAAHAAGLLHRDFKPDNVLVDRDNEPRITDFGLARELAGDDESAALPVSLDSDLPQLTATGALAGTPAYMPPEQLLGAQTGPEADQFSYCVALFEVLYGARPFHPASSAPDARIEEIRAGRVIKPAEARDVPGWLHALIVRGLAFEPAQRWPSMLALVDALERGLGRRRRRAQQLGAALAVAGAASIVVAVRAAGSSPAAPPSCAEVATRGNFATTILVCKDEYARTNDPKTGARLANALQRASRLGEAATLATELLATPVRADALFTLGKVAGEEGRAADAVRSLELAGELHREQQRWGEAAGDLLAAAEFSPDFLDQLVALDKASRDASRAGAKSTELTCHIAAARVLSEIGARSGALAELARAEPLVTRQVDRVGLDFEYGNVDQNVGENALAVPAFERALASAEKLTDAGRALSARLNLAYSLAEAGRLRDATAQLKASNALDPTDRKLAVRLSLEARIAARGGEPDRAAGLIERALALTDADDSSSRLGLEVQRAEVAFQQVRLSDAETWARRAIATIETLRSTQPPVELRSWMIPERRIPYEILFASLAARGDARSALIVLDRYRGLGVLAALVHAEDVEPGGAFPVAELARLLPPLERNVLATPAAEQAVLDAVHAESMLALVVAHGEVWRIVAENGQLQVASLGALSALRPELERFRAAPVDRSATDALGARLVPASLARSTGRVLHVIADEPLASLPIEALRVGGRPLIALRPIVRAARPSAMGCVSRPRSPHRVVTLEAASATRATLFGVPRSTQLRIQGAFDHSGVGDALVLRDGRVRALEIAGHGERPAQVVLDGTGAGPGGTAGLAMAFVAAGADQVIATVRPVPGVTVSRFADQLAHAGDGDLVHALALVQRSGHDDWIGVAAFGRAMCTP